MRNFFPETGSEAEWNAAYYRLEDYLRALHVVNKVRQSQIILRLLQAAAVKHALNPDQSPTTLALELAYAAMDRWFEKILPRPDRVAVVGPLSLLITDAAEKWPTVFLSDEVPLDFYRVMQESQVRAGPDLQVSSMVPRPIDISPLVETIFEDSSERLQKGAVLMAFVVVSAIAAVFLFFISR
jgi:hypothetical protein